MILGTSSNAGKTTIVTGLCRIFSNKGLRTAPFKSQNMSLNAGMINGKCIAAAQIYQAEAARQNPTEYMNPVLLRPLGCANIEVYLFGETYAKEEAGTYYDKTGFFLGKALEAYRRLEKENEFIIIEGAGSAAEVNLYDKDIANVLLARELQLPIILVADIERGGVFAQVYGTVALLPENIRKNVKGIIINKFRGNAALFAEGKTILEKLTGVPVLGIVPYLKLHLPEEDSLSEHAEYTAETKEERDAEYNKLAAHLAAYVDMDTVFKIAGVSCSFKQSQLSCTDSRTFSQELTHASSKANHNF